MREIHKKTWPEYFQAILNGRKNFELRLNDFEVSEGDTLVLEEYDPETKKYTGRKIEKQVTYVLKTKIDQLFWSREEIEENGIQVISLR